MSKFKLYFNKVGSYIKNTAWIQPLLIVIVIFVILFSLNPITNALKKGWTSLTTRNNMEKISYQEYVDMVHNAKEDDQYIIVFSQKNCDHCPIFYKSMNEYLKAGYNTRIYNVDLTTKNTKIKVDGVKTAVTIYKDATAGLVGSTSNNKINAQDYVKQLDNRIFEFVKSNGGSYTELQEISDSTYTYVSTPLVVWYKGNIETRMTNIFETNSMITLNSKGDKATTSSFKSFIQDFGGDTSNTVKADDWDDQFNLTYSSHKNIKDAF